MKRIILFIAALCVVILPSCNDFLTVNPTNQAPAGTAISTAADAKVMINGLMRQLTSSSYYGRNFQLYGDVRGGDVTLVSLGRGNDALYIYNHSASSNSYSGFWSQGYYCMLQINNLIANITRIESEGNGSAALTDYKGQALTLRALLYFDLVRLYGKPYTEDNGASFGVPMPLEVLDVYTQMQRSTVAENYNQIVKDLTDAAPMLSKNLSNGFVNYYANRALLSRAYLFMGRAADALAPAEEIINSGRYRLYANNEWVASWAREFGSESIFELGLYQDEADLGTGSLGYYFIRQGKRSNAMGWFMASDFFLDRLGADPGDVRWGIMEYDEISATRLGSCNKYIGNSAGAGDKGSASAVNIKVVRLSEIYLIAAEAAFATDKAKAAGYLNEIRKRSPNLEPATAANITLDMILDERSKELFQEGFRYFDMMRHNKTIVFDDSHMGTSTITTRPNSIDRSFYKTILPISQGEMDANPSIVSQQNPGY
jgi:SusD family.